MLAKKNHHPSTCHFRFYDVEGGHASQSRDFHRIGDKLMNPNSKGLYTHLIRIHRSFLPVG